MVLALRKESSILTSTQELGLMNFGLVFLLTIHLRNFVYFMKFMLHSVSFMIHFRSSQFIFSFFLSVPCARSHFLYGISALKACLWFTISDIICLSLFIENKQVSWTRVVEQWGPARNKISPARTQQANEEENDNASGIFEGGRARVIKLVGGA